MKNLAAMMKFFAVMTLMLVIAGCHKAQTQDDAIRAAVQQHLVALKTLNLQAMDMQFNKVTIDRGQADADVTFRPKAGATAGAEMQISYHLEKRDGNWSVVKTGAAGGAINHPAPGANPHTQPPDGNVHGSLPNFQDVLGQQKPGGDASLPAGHPPVNPPAPK